MHTSLDGFVAGPNGEMDWIRFDNSMFDFVGTFTDEADAALYGRVTYEMMESYWPTAGDQPNASQHDKQHSAWYNKVDKIVLSKSLQGQKKDKTIFISDNTAAEINKIRNQPGKNILIFGSPQVVHVLMQDNLIDDYWLFVNPLVLGKGIPFFFAIKEPIRFKKMPVKEFACGVTGLHYIVERE